jgi:cytochrome oxidase assembly protein ShyY1
LSAPIRERRDEERRTASHPLTAPEFFAVARRPRWIAALVLALAIASGFAALGQWQLARSVENATVVGAPDTEDAVPLTTIAEPQTAVTQDQLGRRVTVSGTLVPGDTVVLGGRNNGSTSDGFWAVGHVVTQDGVSLAVALGWSPDRAKAEAAATGATVSGDLIGRYLPSESPTDTDIQAAPSALSVADLVNRWTDPGPVYGGYLVLDAKVAGLDRIIAPHPITDVSLNLLNVFYAIEWALFAGFAIYLWYRVVRDVVERDAEDRTVE